MALQSISTGQLTPWSTWGEYNNVFFAIQQAINKMQTATLVRVEACTNSGDASPVGFVDITPLVNQIDGNGNNSTPHTTIYGVPYSRIQGGTNALIMDPVKGDIGIALFASRDISNVKSTKKQANPGSFRTYDFSDAMYLGGMLNGTPLQYIQFTANGIKIVSPQTVTIQAPTITLDGDLEVTGNATIQGDVTGEGTSLHLHRHTSESAGTPTSPPLP